MKRKHLLLAMGLGTIGIANAQTTTNTYSSTSTTSSYATSPTTTDSSSSMNNSSMNNSGNMNSNTTNNMNSTTDGTTTTYSTNAASPGTTTTTNTASPAYGTTTTTTTTTNGSYSTSDPNYTTTTTRTKDDRDWGKEGKFGIYAGVNFSRFVNEPIPDGAYRAGWQAGLYGRSGGTVFGQIGLEYRNSTTNLVRRGTGQTGQTPAEVRGQIDNHFLAIPAYVGLRIGGALGLRIQAGLELSTLFAVGNNNFGLGKDDLNRTILGGLGGVGINLGPLTLDAVYNVGLQNVFQNADTKRQLLAFNLGFRF